MQSHYVATLSTAVKQRIKTFKKLHVDYLKLNGEFYKEAALENKYFTRYNEFFTNIRGMKSPRASTSQRKESAPTKKRTQKWPPISPSRTPAFFYYQ